jgi:hypothetical protein
MEQNGNDVQGQPQVTELDPNIKAIFTEIENKLNQVNMLLVLQFTSNIALNCISQLPGMKKEIMGVVTAPIVASFNAALQYSDALKRAEGGVGPGQGVGSPDELPGERPVGATETRSFN